MSDPADISEYLDLITSEHNQQPKFVATVSAIVQPVADNKELLKQAYTYYDIDTAIGVQLDAVGEWVGRTRFVSLPNVFFSLGVAGLGFSEGSLQGPFDSGTYQTKLDDNHYRILLKAVILNNIWDGSIPDAYAMWDILLAGQTGLRLLIQDSGQLSMILALERISTAPIDAVLQAMFSTGELSIKPAGVFISTYIVQNTVNQPLFGLGVQNASIAGFGTGGFGTETAGG
jgi:hypothetical protein